MDVCDSLISFFFSFLSETFFERSDLRDSVFMNPLSLISREFLFLLHVYLSYQYQTSRQDEKDATTEVIMLIRLAYVLMGNW